MMGIFIVISLLLVVAIAIILFLVKEIDNL
jgi:hypothetical protein